ncbi:hypothetical protein B0T14DRAFT_560818 [Immersiella caudata]|uniref:Uncharacterized protein n=1 Tax=Immersiella caudata TaxID=314043 RepID=A0AA39XFV5_9PEZI|nr:hypothetical protein B0T14DRAFT_560818 [Immersiella caudata]
MRAGLVGLVDAQATSGQAQQNQCGPNENFVSLGCFITTSGSDFGSGGYVGTTVQTLINPGATLTINNTLIDAGSTLTLINPAATATVVSTFTKDGTTITKTVIGVSQGTGPVEECYDAGCTLRLRYGALRLPATTPDGAVCAIKTRSWVQGATTLLPDL